MNALALVGPKLSKIVPRLGSNHTGEIVAAAIAIGKVLEAAGADWNDFAEALVSVPSTARRVPLAEKWLRDAEFLRVRAFLLRPHERKFANQMVSRQLHWGPPSERQQQ